MLLYKLTLSNFFDLSKGANKASVQVFRTFNLELCSLKLATYVQVHLPAKTKIDRYFFSSCE